MDLFINLILFRITQSENSDTRGNRDSVNKSWKKDYLTVYDQSPKTVKITSDDVGM